jgi:hypothetical protein
MMEEGIFFTPYSLNLTAIFLARKDIEMHLVLLKPRLNTPGCVHGRICHRKKCIIVRKQQLHRRMKMVI